MVGHHVVSQGVDFAVPAELWQKGYKTFFRRNYVAIGVTSVKNLGKYAASGVNYAHKVL